MNSFLQYISEKVRDSLGNLINPATKELQTTSNDLADAIYELVARLDFLPSIRGTLADIRVTSTGGTVGVSSLPTLAAVTTLTTLTNQQQIGGMMANTQIPSLMNTTAHLSNISNVTNS